MGGRFTKLLVLGDFNVHADKITFSQALDLVSAMATLGLSQFFTGPTHQAGYTLDLIYGMRIQIGLIQSDRVPWSDHFALKVRIDIPPPSCIDRENIFARPRRLMDPIGFQNALRDPMPPVDSVDDLVEVWHSWLMEAIDKIAP